MAEELTTEQVVASVVAEIEKMKDPATGKNLIEARKVDDVRFEDGRIRFNLRVPPTMDRRVRLQIEQEIIDRVEYLPGVPGVTISIEDPLD